MEHHHHHSHEHHEDGQHGHGHGDDKTLGDHNRDHFDGVASTIFKLPWIVRLSSQISNELKEAADWIGLGKKNSSGLVENSKMLDYASGDGLASRTLAPYFSQIRGLDISSGMVTQYNLNAAKEGFSADKMHAIQGDLNDTATTPYIELSTPEYNDFDLVVMSMALHHVENPETMILKLTERLRTGGVLLIVDLVAHEESGLTKKEWGHGGTKHTVSRMGFTEEETKPWFEKAGLENWGWRWFSERSNMLDSGVEQQLVLARGVKK